MRRALCIALALLMLLTVVPLTVFAEETETRTIEKGDIIGFGSYPQSEVTDETLKNALTAAADSTDNWTSYGYYIGNEQYEPEQSDYMKYTDVEYNGSKYRGVYFTQYRPYITTYSSATYNSEQEDNGYSTSTVYWFKYEPMKWQVLSYDSTTGEAVVLSKNIIDSQQYYYTDSGTRTINGETVYTNNYEHSDIRTWLNNTFYNTAFGTSEKNAIVATTLDNSAYSTSYSEYDSNSTTDNVWLLSYSEAQNTAYGFTSDTTRQATGTAYALCQGLWESISNGCFHWRLRSAGSSNSIACLVDYGGWVNYIHYYLNIVDYTSVGVRPALTLKLTSVIDPTEPTTEETTVEPIEETTTVPTTEPTTKPSEEPTTKPSEESTKPTTEPTTEPSEETTTNPSEESTTKSSEESTTKSGEESTTKPSEEPTTKPSEESTTKPSEESTTKPSEESTTKSSEESTTKPTTEPTTKPSEESTTKSSEESTTKSSEESTTKPTTETTKPAAEDSDESTTKGECGHICHKSGIAKFFYKILRFFWKLFKINKVCDCGFEHY